MSTGHNAEDIITEAALYNQATTLIDDMADVMLGPSTNDVLQLEASHFQTLELDLTKPYYGPLNLDFQEIGAMLDSSDIINWVCSLFSSLKVLMNVLKRD